MLRRLRSTRLDALVSPHLAILILRIGAAALIMTHGYPKLMQLLEGNFAFADPIGIGAIPSLILVVFAEVICGAFLMVGLYTRVFLIPLIINMAVAFFIAHAPDPFAVKELSLIFLITFVVLFLTGPGRISFDRLFRS